MRASDCMTSSRDVTRFSAIAFCMSGMVASTTENFVATANRIARCIMARECSGSALESRDLRPRLVDLQCVSVDFLAIQTGDRRPGMFIIGVVDEAEAARHAGGAVLGDVRRVRRTARMDH